MNWEDQSAGLTLAEAKKLSRKTVFGGIDHNGVLRNGTAGDVKDQVLQAARDAGLKNLVLAPGCVITVDTPEENLKAAVEATRTIVPWATEWEAFS